LTRISASFTNSVFKTTFPSTSSRRDSNPSCAGSSTPFWERKRSVAPRSLQDWTGLLIQAQSSHIDIVANDAQIKEDGSEWKPIWRHDTELGHDKALSIQEARKEAELECEDGSIPLIVFIGDGVSDLPAARQADVLFARRGLRLEEYCQENNIPYIPFDTFADIQKKLKEIMDEDQQKTGGVGVPLMFNPRANLWRRVSSKAAVPRYVAMSPTNEDKMFLWPDAFTELTKVHSLDSALPPVSAVKV
jgi:hypothetical protein